MSTRKIKDAVDHGTKELIYFKCHAKATYMSDGSTVEDTINNIDSKIDLSDYVTTDELEGYAKIEAIPSLEGYVKETELPNFDEFAKSEDIPSVTDKQDKLISGTNIKTINNQSILGSGNITIEGGSSDANVQAVDTGDVLDDVNIEYATTAYVDNKVANINLTDYATITYVNGLVGDINSVLESIINGGPSINLISITVNDFYTGTSYVCQAEEGMTWVDWINSKYNTYEWYISDGYIFLSDGLTLAFQGAPFTEPVLTGYVMEDGAVGFHTYDLDSNN